MTLIPPEARETMPALSVIITNYNYAGFVGQAIESVLRQTAGDLECIVVDDGSTDGSRQVIANYPEVRTLFIENGGQAAAARAALRLARAPVVIFLDSDDWLYPEACARVLAEWRPGTSMMLFRLDIWRGDSPTGERNPAGPFITEGALEHVMRHYQLPAAPTTGNAFSREYASELLENALNCNANCFDIFLCLSAPSCGHVHAIDASLGAYRVHGSNVSLASRVSVRRIRDHLSTRYWAQKTMEATLARRGIAHRPEPWIRGAYELKWLLETADLPPEGPEIPVPAHWRLATLALHAFASDPAIPLPKRAKNMLWICVFALLPRSLRATLGRRKLTRS